MERRKILLVVAVVVAALGAGLVFVYAQGAEDRAKDKEQQVAVLVATQQILPGESASDAFNAGKLKSTNVPSSQALTGSTDDGTAFTDQIALTTIFPGEQLLTQKFGTIADIEGTPTLPIPDGKGAATFELTDAQKVGSFAQPGSHVAIYVNQADPTALLTDEQRAALQNANARITAPACLIEDDVLVLGVGSTKVGTVTPTDGTTDPGAGNAQGEVVGTTLMTVAVDSDQAATLIGLSSTSSTGDDGIKITFVLRNEGSELKPAKSCKPLIDSLKQSLVALPTTDGNG